MALLKANTGDRELALIVRGPIPTNFFARLRDRLIDTFTRFPGLEYEQKVPCLCSEGCEYEFDLRDLEAALEDDPPVTEFRCTKRRKMASVPEMLYGHRFSPGNEAFNQKILAKLESIEGGIKENREYEQREFTKLFNSIQATRTRNARTSLFYAPERELTM